MLKQSDEPETTEQKRDRLVRNINTIKARLELYAKHVVDLQLALLQMREDRERLQKELEGLDG